MLYSPAMDRPLLVLSDTHLSRAYGGESGQGLAALLAEFPDSEIVFAGDILDLSLDAAGVPLEDSLGAALAPHAKFVNALRAHVGRGGKLSFVPGNHDANLGGNDEGEALRRHLNAPNPECVEVSPWFIRRGDVHIEHGHLYDPDCAPNHPLATPNPKSEGLGTALMRRFIEPNDVLSFAHSNQTTPTSGFFDAFRLFGSRAPLIITNYFRTAITLCLEAGLHKERVRRSISQGETLIEACAAKHHLSPDTLQALLIMAPEPTHHSFRSTFERLYFDRILAGLALTSGVALLSTAGLGATFGPSNLIATKGSLTASGALLAALGASFLFQSMTGTKKQFAGAVVGQLADAAKGVAALTKSDLVVFGHSHVEVDEPGYVNLGSFGFGKPDKPYLLVNRDGRHEYRHLSTSTQV